MATGAVCGCEYVCKQGSKPSVCTRNDRTLIKGLVIACRTREGDRWDPSSGIVHVAEWLCIGTTWNVYKLDSVILNRGVGEI